MTTTDPWDDFEPRSDGTFVKFDTPGQAVVGTIIRREKGKNFAGEACPQLVIDTDQGEQIVTAGQANLHQGMLTKKNELVPGARVRITFTGVGQAKPGQSAPKLFSIEVKPADSADTNVVATAPAAASGASADDF